MYLRAQRAQYNMQKLRAFMSAKSERESDTFASSILVGFPKVNLVSIPAGILALVSVFLPWWGLDGSAFGVAASVRWSLWGRPYLGDPSSSQAIAQATQTMGLLNVVACLPCLSSSSTFLVTFSCFPNTPTSRSVLRHFKSVGCCSLVSQWISSS